MSEDEKEQLMATLFKQHLAETQHLGCLNAKAEQMLKNMAMVSRLLKGETTGHFKDGRFVISETPNSINVDYAGWPTPEEIVELLESREKARTKIANSEKQLRSMGFGNYFP